MASCRREDRNAVVVHSTFCGFTFFYREWQVHFFGAELFVSIMPALLAHPLFWSQ